MSKRNRIARAVGWIALASLLALAQPAAVDAGERTGDQRPSELWKAYPLDPSRGEMRIRNGPADGQDASPPNAAEAPRPQPGRPGMQAVPSPAGDASSHPFVAPWWQWLAVAVLACVVALAVVALVFPAALVRLAALTAWPGRSLAAVSRPTISWPPGSSRPHSFPPLLKKGSIVVNFRRKPQPPHQPDMSVERAEQQPMQEQPPTDAVARISRYSVGANVGEHDELGEASPEKVPVEEASAVDEDEGAEAAAVGEEIQTVLASAQDAAARIRRRAEHEAERIRNEAASAAAQVTEGQRVVEAERAEAERIRADAESYAAEVRAAADAAAEQRRTEAEGVAARILEEAERRRDAADAALAQNVAHVEEEARQRAEKLEAEIKRQEERLEGVLEVLRGMLRGMSSELAAFRGHEEMSDDLTDIAAKR